MDELAAVAERVRRHWLSQGLRVLPITPYELERLRSSRSARIPEEYEDFLRVAGLPDDEDREGFRFWSPIEVRATNDVLHNAGYASTAAEPSVIIADYLQESWWFALWVDGPFRGHVSLVLGSGDGRDPQPPLGTFVDFLLAYLGDDERLYPPSP